MINQGTTQATWRARIMALAAVGLLAGSVSTGSGEGTAPTMLIPGGDGNAVHASGPIGGSKPRPGPG